MSDTQLSRGCDHSNFTHNNDAYALLKHPESRSGLHPYFRPYPSFWQSARKIGTPLRREHKPLRKGEKRNLASPFIEIELRSANQRWHWSPASQAYAPANVLLEHLEDGWDISPIVGQEEYYYGSGRHGNVYYFELTRGSQMMVMPVLGNPIVHRLIHQRQLQIKRLNCDEALPGGTRIPEMEHLWLVIAEPA